MRSETQTLCAGRSKVKPKIFSQPQSPSQGAGRPKFNQPEKVTTFTYRHSLFPFNRPFSRWTWLADTRTSLHSGYYWMMDVEVTTDTIRCAQLKSKSSTNQHPVFTGWIPFLSPNQQCRSTEEKTSRKAVVHKIVNKFSTGLHTIQQSQCISRGQGCDGEVAD